MSVSPYIYNKSYSRCKYAARISTARIDYIMRDELGFNISNNICVSSCRCVYLAVEWSLKHYRSDWWRQRGECPPLNHQKLTLPTEVLLTKRSVFNQRIDHTTVWKAKVCKIIEILAYHYQILDELLSSLLVVLTTSVSAISFMNNFCLT